MAQVASTDDANFHTKLIDKIDEALNYIENESNRQPRTDRKEPFVVDIYCKMPNHQNVHLKFNVHYLVQLCERATVNHLLHASIQVLNHRLSRSHGREYHISDPDEEMISKSFCDITSIKECRKCLNEFDKNDMIAKGLYLYCDTNYQNIVDENTEHAPSQQHLQNDIAHTELFEVPVYIKIPNRSNSNEAYEIHDQLIAVSNQIYLKHRVETLLFESIRRLNEKIGAVYHVQLLMNQDMISKSFCNITSPTERLKYLRQFDKKDIVSKGLHLYCDTVGDDSNYYQRNIQTLMALGYEQYVCELVLAAAGNKLDQALQNLSNYKG
eukprot:774704_1